MAICPKAATVDLAAKWCWSAAMKHRDEDKDEIIEYVKDNEGRRETLAR
jgi:hypothetical protein